MVFLLSAAGASVAFENADKVAQGYETHPVSYSLALAVAALGILGAVIVTLFWWGARGQAQLHEQNWKRELERNQDLRRERDRAQDETDRIRREHMQDLARFLLAGESLAKLYDALQAGKIPKPKP